MPPHTQLIAMLAGAFVLALAFGFVATKLRAPPLVGYLMAGIAFGAFTPGSMADTNLAAQLAEVGVVLLMFGVGLRFSPADLLKMRRVALPGAIAQMVVATAIGAGLAIAFGWTLGASMVFGLALSVASTVVLLQALERRGALDSVEGHIAMGWLIVEDLAMVLVIVMLPVIAADVATQMNAGDVAWAVALILGKILVFGALALFVGTRVVPWLLMQVTRTGSRELFTLAILAIALGIAYGSAAVFDVSFALGAFFAGVVLSESELSKRAAADSLPLKDAFAVLFFVSNPLGADCRSARGARGQGIGGICHRAPFRISLTDSFDRLRKSCADRRVLIHPCEPWDRARAAADAGKTSDPRERHPFDSFESARVRMCRAAQSLA
jgi:monovalent cation:H+ antiporter-2, CPA2 family